MATVIDTRYGEVQVLPPNAGGAYVQGETQVLATPAAPRPVTLQGGAIEGALNLYSLIAVGILILIFVGVVGALRKQQR